jgi:hypothetical protein
MAQANDIVAPPFELTIDLRLRSGAFTFAIIHRNQKLIAGSGHGEGLALQEIAAFVERSLVR